MDERMRRFLIAAAESVAIDFRGVSIVSRATGVYPGARLHVAWSELGNPYAFGGAIP